MAKFLALSLAFAGSSPSLAQGQSAEPLSAATVDLRRHLEALLPQTRIDDHELRRALDPPRWRACRGITVEWSASRSEEADAASDGTLKFVAESPCQEPYDVRASARIGTGSLLAVVTDRSGALLWWKQMPDVRRVHPTLFPQTGDARVDRENRRLHAEGVRIAHSRFSVEIPADRRVARLLMIEVPRRDSSRSPLRLGTVDVAAL